MSAVRYVLLWLLLPLAWRVGAAAPSIDWPMFRGGPALVGIAGGSLPDHLALLWTFKTGGPVKSSAAIVQDRVFIGSDDGNLYALTLADGKKVWAFKAGDAVESSPLVLGGKVFVGASDGVLYALEAETGKLAWKYETGDKILGAPNWVTSGEKTSVLVGSYDCKLHCLDAATGRTNWVYETGNYINGSRQSPMARRCLAGAMGCCTCSRWRTASK